MTQEVTLRFNGIIGTIEANESGFYNLNDVWRIWGLHARKRPNQWSNSQSEYFFGAGNLQSQTIQRIGRGGANRAMFGTQEVLYAYAMWCDVEFYAAVVEAFTSLANGDVEAAVETVEQVTRVSRKRETLRYNHPNFTSVIRRSRSPQLTDLDETHRYRDVLSLVSEHVFGLTPATVKRSTRRILGRELSPRDYIEFTQNEQLMDAYESTMSGIEALLRANVDYDTIIMLYPVGQRFNFEEEEY